MYICTRISDEVYVYNDASDVYILHLMYIITMMYK